MSRGARDARRRAILAKRYPGRGPADELDPRGWSARIADPGRLFPAGAEYPADAVRRLRAERAARERDGAGLLGGQAGAEGTPPAGAAQDAPGRPATPGPAGEGR